ncbi:hypothetical protein LguiA_025125 [Lonicera macranthoides]
MAFSIERKIIFVALIVLGMWASQATSRALPEASMTERHEEWMSRYGRVYKDSTEKERRFNIFKNNVEFIESFNSDGNRKYKLGINEFADQTNEEFRASWNGLKTPTLPKSAKTTVFSWGDNGYIMMQRDVEAKGGLCGIAMDSSYPTA